ncbi:MAG: hypothetical protein GY801_08495 [bacterium]|nr:hypothetical protein [bacterium]
MCPDVTFHAFWVHYVVGSCPTKETIMCQNDLQVSLGFTSKKVPPASRIIGEMPPEVQDVPGGDRLLEYESRVSILLREHPFTVICQYDANVFDGATIMDVLKVHPQTIVNGAVVQNPFFIQPEEYLQKRS